MTTIELIDRAASKPNRLATIPVERAGWVRVGQTVYGFAGANHHEPAMYMELNHLDSEHRNRWDEAIEATLI